MISARSSARAALSAGTSSGFWRGTPRYARRRSHDEIEIFLQQQPGYVAPDDPGRRERHAWNVYIITDDVRTLYEEYASVPGVKISRPLCLQEYGMMEFDVIDLNGHRLVFAQPAASE